jgi:bleomycin hydrolase
MKTNHADTGGIAPIDIEQYRIAFGDDPKNRLVRNAVAKTTITSVALDRDAVTRLSHTYSHMVKAGKSTSQNRSGRCWMFAGLNLFRVTAAEKMGIEEFELSQNYLMFWDKLEKSNFFLESILGTLDEPTEGRLIAWLVTHPIQDGGQWDMFVNLVKKYGVVPKEVMPETESSSNSGIMNARITEKLREFAARLRQGFAAGASESDLRAQKAEMLETIYRMLSIHLGEPPREFLWQWRDKEKEFHRDGVVTPQEFREKYIPLDLDGMVCLIHCPQASKEYHTLYTVAYLGNVVGGHAVRYVNVPLDVLKAATAGMIKDGKPVWFGCDVGKMFDRELGLMDLDVFDYPSVYGTTFGLNKAERLDYGQSLMTHAMVLTGVDLDEEEKPRKWRVENSWGDSNGDKGFMLMTDPWFDEYLYEVVVEKQYVPAEVVALLETEASVLPPWDPMGSLASVE